MRSTSIFSNNRLRVLIFFSILSLLVSACDIMSAPETEDIAFEGAPQVVISSPLNGDTYREGVGVNILLRVDNAGSDIARVAIEVDGEIIGEAILPNPNGDPSFTVNNGWPASGEGAHTITTIASRGDGTTSDPATVTINVVAAEDSQSDDMSDDDTSMDDDDMATEEMSQDDETDDASASGSDDDSSAQATTAPTQAQPTAVPATDEPEATNTPSQPQVRITTGANVRSGPGVVFDPPIGSLAAGATTNILAVNPAGTWYKIQYYNGEGWVSAQVAEAQGDISGLPREAGPPTPVPFTPTPVATNTPATAPDLSVTNVVVDPHPFVCNESSEVSVTIANNGTAASGGTSVLVQDIFNGQVGANTNAPVPALAPGETHTAVMFLTVSTNFGEAHNTRVTVDPNGQVSENNENNNVRNEQPYVLGTGNC